MKAVTSFLTVTFILIEKAKQSLYRPGMAQKFPGS